MKYLILIFTFCFGQVSISQTTNGLEKNLFKINILSPGFSYEKALGESNTFFIESSMGFGFSTRGNRTTYLFAPLLNSQYRMYYNLNKRQSKNRDISGNSGSYFALHGSYYFEPINSKKEFFSLYDGFTAGGVWGFQKTYKSGLNLGANAGLGYNFSSNKVQELLPILNFTLGWVIQ
jgi:hypothetical protein